MMKVSEVAVTLATGDGEGQMRGWTWMALALGLGWSLPSLAQYSEGVICESRDGGYRECYTGFSNQPTLSNQLSSSSCIEGRSWGHRPGAVWVSNGCRGEFEEGDGGSFSDEDLVVCESRDNRYVECQTGFRGAVELVEQFSSKNCTEGRTWGRTRGGIWVDRGCRASFAGYGGGQQSGGHWQQSDDYTLECESKDNSQRICPWDWNAGTPYLLEQLSRSPCVKGRSWSYDQRRQSLWVDQGCRAVFGAR